MLNGHFFEEVVTPTLPAGTSFDVGISGSRAGAWLSWVLGIWRPKSSYGSAAS